MPVSFSSALAGLSTFALEWDLQGEAGDPGTAATVSAFEVTFDLRTPPPPAVPEPAVLWLMLSGLIGVGALRKPVDRRVAG